MVRMGGNRTPTIARRDLNPVRLTVLPHPQVTGPVGLAVPAGWGGGPPPPQRIREGRF